MSGVIDEIRREIAAGRWDDPPVYVVGPGHVLAEAVEAALAGSGRTATVRLRARSWVGLARELLVRARRVPPPVLRRTDVAARVLAALMAEPALVPDAPVAPAAQAAFARHAAHALWQLWQGPPERPEGRPWSRLAARVTDDGAVPPAHLLRRAAEALTAGEVARPGRLFVFWDDEPTPAEAALLDAFGRHGAVARWPLRALFPPAPHAPAVEIGRAPSAAVEVRVALGRAARLVAAGVPPHEIALALPDPELYRPLLVREARERGLPLSFGTEDPVGAPWRRLALALLDILADPGDPVAWLPIADLPGLTGAARALVGAARSAGRMAWSEGLAGAPAVLEPFVARGAPPAPAMVWVRRLRRALAWLLAPGSDWDDGWEALWALEALARRAGARSLTREGWRELMAAALATQPPKALPREVGAIEVRRLDEVAGLRRRALFALGLVEETLGLREPLSADLAPAETRRTVTASELVAVPTDLLWASSAARGVDGHEAAPSALLDELALRQGIAVRTLSDEGDDAWTARRLARELLVLGVAPSTLGLACPPGVPAGPVDDPPTLPATTVAALVGEPAEVSVSLLETAAECGFRALAVLLGLEPEAPVDEVDPERRGRAVHAVLAQVVGRPDFTELSPAELGAALRRALTAVLARLDVPVLRVPRRGEALLDAWLAELEAVCRYLQAEQQRSAFRVEAVELAFGGETAPVIETGRGRLRLRGRIDRLDRAGRRVRLVDYKTGRRPLRYPRLAGGLDLQLFAYAAAVAAQEAAAVEAVVYWPLALPARRVDEGPVDDAAEAFRPRGFYAAHTGLVPLLGEDRYHRIVFDRQGRLSPTGDGVPADAWPDLLALGGRLMARAAEVILAGDFRARPWRHGEERACDRCRLAAVCRHDGRTFRPLPDVRDWRGLLGPAAGVGS